MRLKKIFVFILVPITAALLMGCDFFKFALLSVAFRVNKYIKENNFVISLRSTVESDENDADLDILFGSEEEAFKEFNAPFYGVALYLTDRNSFNDFIQKTDATLSGEKGPFSGYYMLTSDYREVEMTLSKFIPASSTSLTNIMCMCRRTNCRTPRSAMPKR